MKPNSRIVELCTRLTSSGDIREKLSASELHEICNLIFELDEFEKLNPTPNLTDRLFQLGSTFRGVANEAEELLKEAGKEIQDLNQWINDCQSGMYINCVYCGHRYGKDDGHHLESMREILQAHVAQCPKHPLSAATSQLRATKDSLEGIRMPIAEMAAQVISPKENTMSRLRDSLTREIDAIESVLKSIQPNPWRPITGTEPPLNKIVEIENKGYWVRHEKGWADIIYSIDPKKPHQTGPVHERIVMEGRWRSPCP